MKYFLPQLLLAILFIVPCQQDLFSQTIKYTYDAAGNRTDRNVIVMKSAKIDSTNLAQANKQSVDNPSFSESLGEQKIVIYPNPTRGQLLVEIQGYQQETNASLYLYDLSGKLLIRKDALKSNTPLDLTNYPMGTYMLKITIDGKISQWKIIKE